MRFEELARRRRNDSLGATHDAGTHQQHKHEYTRGHQYAPVRSRISSRGECVNPLNSHHMTELETPILPETIVPLTVQFTLASTAYFSLSVLFPAHETMLDHAILDQKMLSNDKNISGSDTKKEVDDYRVDETGVV